ncbi:MAG TPA: GNAT family N-acetyltransferase [Chitinophagaceae bacterium]|nr:GNAT family N-acetyltransferase [Chitinophagaceae bacterium]
MNSYIIRNSRKEDFESVFAIWLENQSQAIGKTVSAKTAEPYKNELYHQFNDDKYSHFYIAENSKNQIIGWQALLSVISNPLLKMYAAQSNTYVTKDYHDSDIGYQLVAHAVNDAKRHGIEQIYGWVKADNSAINKIAQKFTSLKLNITKTDNLPDINLYVIQVSH